MSSTNDKSNDELSNSLTGSSTSDIDLSHKEISDQPSSGATVDKVEKALLKEKLFEESTSSDGDVLSGDIKIENSPRTSASSILQKSKDNGKKLLLGIIGTISAAAIPIWQIYFVETSDVKIEIASISRIKSPNFKVPLETDELMLLEPYISDEFLYEYNAIGERGDKIDYPVFSMEILTLAYDKAKQELKNISITKASLQENILRIDSYLDPNNSMYLLTEFRVSELKEWDLSNYIDDAEAIYYEEQVLKITRSYSQMSFNEGSGPQIKVNALEYLLSDVKEDITDVIAANDNLLEILRDNIRSIETQLDKFSEEQMSRNTFFKVEVVASNSGRVSTSLRPMALMRVKISDENYVDIRLQMDDYREQAELQSSSTNIIHYRSSELLSFPREDQSLINTFWGSTGRVKIFTLDTKHNIFSSNQIAFVDNLNQKVMIDKLKEVATRSMR